MQALRDGIYAIAEANHPCSVRQIYYVGIGRLWDKDQGQSRANYSNVSRNAGIMRERGDLPWRWLTDSTRFARRAPMFSGPAEAFAAWSAHYRRDLWERQPRRVEVWAESDSTASLVEPVTRPLGVGLYSCRGQASKDFAWEAAQVYREIAKPVTIIYVGDWDASGLAIPRSLGQRLARYSDGAVEITFERLAVSADDVASGEFTNHAANRNDPSYGRFAEACADVGLVPQTSAVEVEALPPPELRQRVEDRLLVLVDDPDTWNATLAAEESEREQFKAILDREFVGGGS